MDGDLFNIYKLFCRLVFRLKIYSQKHSIKNYFNYKNMRIE